MVTYPLDRLALRCGSVAEHLGFLALNDVAAALDGEDGRVIGGHMVTLHVFRWGLDLYRATQDADLGIRPAVVRTPELTDRLISMGYSKTAGNRFERPVSGLGAESADPPKAVIDILIPAYTSRPRANRSFGDHLVTTEVPGLATAFKRSATDLNLEVVMLDGEKLEMDIRLPDEAGALILKVLARTVRNEDRDAVDVWRALEVCQAAGIENVDLGADENAVRNVLATQFSRKGGAMDQIRLAQNLSDESAAALETRMQALMARVVGEEGRPGNERDPTVGTGDPHRPGGRTSSRRQRMSDPGMSL